MNNVTDLSEAAATAQFGGKAANLARLLALGMRVPPGFVVSAAALPLGEQLITAILTAFDGLGASYVAVRSSAMSEDGAAAAWAGQLDTFLNVSRENLIKHIEKCIRSVGSDRAKAYAEQQNIASGRVAVVVQAMVDSEISGVAFSAHPVTGSREQMVIEAGLGLGEAIVSGEVTPDTYVVAAADGSTIESFVSSQAKQLVRSSQTTAWQPLDPPVTTAKLNPKQLAELVAATRAVADAYGRPMDVEWAFASGQLYILQARPITAL